MTVTVFYSDGCGLPMPYTVTVLKHGCCKDLSWALGTTCCLRSDERMLLAEVYEHQIYQYLDSPLEPLSSIKDDEHIVAYRFPKRWEELTRMEIFHRSLEMKTYFSSTKVNGDKENGSASEAIDGSTNNCVTNSGPGNHLMDRVELEETSCRDLTFPLCIADDRGLNCRPVLKDSLVKPGKVVKIMLDWTYKEHELYDASYLKDLPKVQNTKHTAKKTQQEAVSLFSCLDAFLKEEPLGPDDMWYCPCCKEHKQATKKLDLWRLPYILVFHLKRFSYSRYLKNKLDTFVNFPIHNLDLKKYVKFKDVLGQSHVYELYAISNHYGGLGGGHYSAYAKLIDENRWYHFDDAHVSPVSEADVKTSAAYVLFYQRVKVHK
ncbi:ubiquitinyl hydrolase 1 [Sarracenia purpurea var. burkii]